MAVDNYELLLTNCSGIIGDRWFIESIANGDTKDSWCVATGYTDDECFIANGYSKDELFTTNGYTNGNHYQ